MNYTYTEKCREISGFGGGYEKACRDMVIAAMNWMDEHPNADPTFSQYKNITGLTVDENEDMLAMQKVMFNAAGGDCTGAMMQYSTNHALFAHKNGWDKYIEKMEEPDTN
jgi:hypothetical protein